MGIFGLFKKKNKNTNISQLHDAAATIIKTQINLGRVEDKDEIFRSRLNTMHSYGYIFGVCDALLQSAKVNDVESMASMAIMYIKIFGEKDGPKFFRAALKAQKDPRFIEGACLGGNELIAFIEWGYSTYLRRKKCHKQKM